MAKKIEPTIPAWLWAAMVIWVASLTLIVKEGRYIEALLMVLWLGFWWQIGEILRKRSGGR